MIDPNTQHGDLAEFIREQLVTYHSQLPRELVDAAARGEETAAREGFERTEVLLGEQIVAAARNSGLTAQWSGSRHERVCLQIRDWRKPLSSRAA
ncbi:hypothetical protein [Mycolicibacterium sp. HS_4_1]